MSKATSKLAACVQYCRWWNVRHILQLKYAYSKNIQKQLRHFFRFASGMASDGIINLQTLPGHAHHQGSYEGLISRRQLFSIECIAERCINKGSLGIHLHEHLNCK